MTLERIGATELLHRYGDELSGHILEVGVGTDPYRGLRAGTSVTIDIDLDKHPQVVADAHALPFRAQAFDSVLASQVLEHLHTPRLAIRELRRVLRAGTGAVLIAVPFLYWLHEEPHDYYRYTTHGLRHLLSDDFAVDEIRSYGGRLAASIDLLLTATPSSTRARRAIRHLRKRLLGAPSGRRRPFVARLLLGRSANEHPLGYFVVARTHPGCAADARGL